MTKTALNIPDGYTTEPDNTGDCYACDFCKVTGYGENSEMDCIHPTPTRTGCADNNVVFVRL